MAGGYLDRFKEYQKKLAEEPGSNLRICVCGNVINVSEIPLGFERTELENRRAAVTLCPQCSDRPGYFNIDTQAEKNVAYYAQSN